MRKPTLDLIAAEFASAVAEFDFDRAEGWLAIAVLAADRGAVSTPPGETSGSASSSR